MANESPNGRMKITSCGITDVGQKRQNNEDNYLINDEINLYVVADGMGGHVGGEYASQIAVTTIEEVIQNVESQDFEWEEGIPRPGKLAGEKLKYAIRLAGKRIFERTTAEPELRGMGTTTVAMLFERNRIYLAHVGDSRAYLIRTGNVHQITEDHSLVNEQIKAGLISPESAKNHKLKNIITRSVGYQEDVEIDTMVRPVQEGDRYVLCSDGLSNLVDATEIKEVVANHGSEQAAQKLVELANSRGGDDNITVVIASVDEIDASIEDEWEEDESTKTMSEAAADEAAASS